MDIFDEIDTTLILRVSNLHLTMNQARRDPDFQWQVNLSLPEILDPVGRSSL